MENLYDEYSEYVARVSCGVARKYFWLMSRDEAIQIGWEAFLSVVNRYDGTSAALTTFASHRIRGAILDEIRKLTGKKVKGKWANNGKVMLDEMESDAIATLLVHQDKHPDVGVNKLMAPISNERHRFVVVMHYSCEMSFSRIADMLGVTESRAYQIHCEALTKLQQTHCTNY